ncbi:MAG: hypothetical protein A4E57_02873 [Syntrophorhabdaceae bacterium PtaU1.Bin034]|nr:MAG: hypothetical protein A4E57_02873 [Syntrophorhabdaceae bacterium PtaU1.Bin034]
MGEQFPAKTISVEVIGCTHLSRKGGINRRYDKVHARDLNKTAGINDVYRYRDIGTEPGDLNPRWRAPPEGKPVSTVTNRLWSLDHPQVYEEGMAMAVEALDHVDPTIDRMNVEEMIMVTRTALGPQQTANGIIDCSFFYHCGIEGKDHVQSRC